MVLNSSVERGQGRAWTSTCSSNLYTLLSWVFGMPCNLNEKDRYTLIKQSNTLLKHSAVKSCSPNWFNLATPLLDGMSSYPIHSPAFTLAPYRGEWTHKQTRLELWRPAKDCSLQLHCCLSDLRWALAIGTILRSVYSYVWLPERKPT